MNIVTKFITSLETYLYGLVGLASGFVVPIRPLLFLCGGLIILDTITGIRAARRRGEKPDSRKASRIIDKTVVYVSAILGCHAVEVVLKIPITMAYFATGAIAFTELFSILENTRKVTGTNIGAIIKRFVPQNMKEEPEPEKEEKEEA